MIGGNATDGPTAVESVGRSWRQFLVAQFVVINMVEEERRKVGAFPWSTGQRNE